jgi:hypothetical protein
MFNNREKSTLAFQVEGRLSTYLSNIDNCKSFSADSQLKLIKMMEMTECIHSLLEHIKDNCLSQNHEFISKNQFSIDKSICDLIQYTFTWKPLDNLKTIVGIAEIRFVIPDFYNLTISNFKTDRIENLANLLIDCITLSFINADKKIQKSLFIIKTKNFENMTTDYTSLLKSELEIHCEQFKTSPTFLYLRHKDNVGYFHKHYSNYAEK